VYARKSNHAHLGKPDTQVAVRPAARLVLFAQLDAIFTVDPVTQPDARVCDMESGRPDDDVDVVRLPVLGFDPVLGDGGDRRRHKLDVGAAERCKPSSVVSDTLAVEGCCRASRLSLMDMVAEAERMRLRYSAMSSSQYSSGSCSFM
jgi:hypothetical protein